MPTFSMSDQPKWEGLILDQQNYF